mmetsp:Transcript_7367/g.29595  ORF Transcript_7367/g.29595 Transcript_7367/m.29595 type:complete len:204 (-) Transcript_7367:48-659(-)
MPRSRSQSNCTSKRPSQPFFAISSTRIPPLASKSFKVHKFHPIVGSVPFKFVHSKFPSPFLFGIPGNSTLIRVKTVKFPTFSSTFTRSSSGSPGHQPSISHRFSPELPPASTHAPVIRPLALNAPARQIDASSVHASSSSIPGHRPLACSVVISAVATKNPLGSYITKSFASYTVSSPVAASRSTAWPLIFKPMFPTACDRSW